MADLLIQNLSQPTTEFPKNEKAAKKKSLSKCCSVVQSPEGDVRGR